MRSCKKGSGLVNKLIDILPFEAHLPGYRFCGPGTKLAKRLKRGDPGINGLDEACKKHDIAYNDSSDVTTRNKADLQLADEAWQRVTAKDSSIGERIAAYGVTNAMKLKAKVGAGCSWKQKKRKGSGKRKVGTGLCRKKKKSQKKSKVPRVIPIPSSGGSLRTVLSKIGMTPKAIVHTAKKIKSVIQKGKKPVKMRKDLYLKPHKSGYGLYLRPYNGDLN